MKFLGLLLALSVMLTAPLHAAPDATSQRPAPAAENAQEHRVALVIGNANYKGSSLRSPINDAKSVAANLRSLGFRVIERTDVDLQKLNQALTEFGNLLRPKSVALFYYAGYAVQQEGHNYLIPVDAGIGSELIKTEAVDVNSLLELLTTNPTRLNLVVLDTCRDTPVERQQLKSLRGLAKMDAPRRTLIAYSAAPGTPASDCTARNGVYGLELAKQMGRPGLGVEAVFKRVRQAVAEATAEQQVPMELSSLTADFYFTQDRTTPADGLEEEPDETDPAAPRATVFAVNSAKRGDVWTYEVIERFTNRRLGEISLQVDDATPDTVSETLVAEGNPPFSRMLERRSEGLSLTYSPLLVGVDRHHFFDPNVYAAGHAGLVDRGRPVSELTINGKKCQGKGVRKRKQKVSVPAGVFEADVIDIKCNFVGDIFKTTAMFGVSAPTFTLFLRVWYSAQHYRPVKMVKRMDSAASSDRDFDEYRLLRVTSALN